MRENEKIGLDDYLCSYSVEEFKKLPIHKIRKRTIQEAIEAVTAKTSFDEIKYLLQQISQLSFESERAGYINRLSEKTGLSKRHLSKDVKNVTKKDLAVQQIIDSSVIISHPSYEIDKEFISLGFKEVIVQDNTPTERNIFIVATDNKYEICHDVVFQAQKHKLIFDVRDRVLTNINERWSKARLFEFVDNPVTAKGLYGELKGILRQYIEFQRDAHYGIVAAWVMATYFHRCFNAFPFLFFYGKKQCGKSRSLDLLERLTFNAIKTKGISVASLADSIDGIRGTFLNDQAEALSNSKNEEILGILTDSYTRGGGKRRIVHISNKARKVVEFETYGPKAFASTKDIDADLKDRCVLIPMIRASREYPYPEAYLPLWRDLRDKLYRLLLTKWKDAREIYQITGAGVSHRVKELWRPIETMLRLENISQAEADGIKSAFLESMQETQTELSDHEIELFETLLEMLKEVKECVFTSDEISKKLKHNEGMSEKALQTLVGKRLTLLSLYIRKAGRKDNKRAYLFNYDHVKNILNRYTQTSGTGGQVVFTQQNQGEHNDHIQYPCGKEVVIVDGNTTQTIPIPRVTTSHKLSGHAVSQVNQGKYHPTTETTKTDLKEITI